VDNAGHRTSVTELSGRTVNYGYDNLYRLTSEAIASDPATMNGAVSYGYDAVGNRTQKVSTLPGYPGGLVNYTANDQLATDTYDNEGNTTASNGNGYVYDFENHLIQAGGNTYAYDGDGTRVQKIVAGVATNSLVDALNPTGYAQVLTENYYNRPGFGEMDHRYIYGLERVVGDAARGATYSYGGNDQLQQKISPFEVLSYGCQSGGFHRCKIHYLLYNKRLMR
jgi:YD repeat-containing protein